MQRLWGWSEQGNKTVTTSGIVSANNTLVQRSYPGATITVYVAGGNNLATIYSDNNSTPLANPFTASNSGYWDFYAAAGRYDVQFSGNNAGIPSPFSLSDISLGAIQILNGLSGENQNLAVGANGNNFNIASANNNHTFNLPRANANNSGYLAAADWASFNNATSYNFSAPLVNNNGTVSITLPLTIAQGGSNSNNKTQAFDNLSPQTTKGDLIIFDGNNALRLAVGNNNYSLVADSANNNGVKWAQVSLTAGVTGILPIANGGSNGNTATQAFTNLAPITTKGDIIVGNNTAVPVRLGVGGNNTSLIADSANANGVKWGQVDLTAGVTGILPIANGGTGANNAANAFALLSPITTKGDLIAGNNGNIGVRLPVGNDGYLLSANNSNNLGMVWAAPVYSVAKYTVASNNNAFVANSLTADVTLFTLGQYQKIAGVTVKPSALFLNPANSITDVQLSLGVGGNSNMFTSNYSIGNNGAVGNSNFQDTALFKSGNMGGNQAVLARFTAAGNNFGNGSATVLTGGSVDVWVTLITIQ